MEEFILFTSRAASDIDRILNAFYNLCYVMFKTSSTGLARMVVDTIRSNPYLLISVSLLIIGFVIGILKRLISV